MSDGAFVFEVSTGQDVEALAAAIAQARNQQLKSYLQARREGSLQQLANFLIQFESEDAAMQAVSEEFGLLSLLKSTHRLRLAELMISWSGAEPRSLSEFAQSFAPVPA